jgi:CspA family cold shock protein
MIELLDAVVVPELRQGRYPQRSSSQRVAEMARAIVRTLDIAATAHERSSPTR